MYGIKISKAGVDVSTGSDADMILTSKYSCLKGSLSGSGSQTVANNGTTVTVTIAHGLSYIPMVQGVFSLDNTEFAILPYFNLLGDGVSSLLQVILNVKADSTNVYLTFNLFELIGGAQNYTIYYKYFIFIDKAKL
jgi:hypothetical protein